VQTVRFSAVEPGSHDKLQSADIREVLDAIGELRAELEGREPEAVAKAREEGISWQEIAQRLRRATSSVFERYRDA